MRNNDLGTRDKGQGTRLRKIAERFSVAARGASLKTKNYQLETNSGFAPTPILPLLTLCQYLSSRINRLLAFENSLRFGYKHAQLRENRCRGFALLITLVVISILLSIGLSLLQITLKQISFSSIARESEVAFYAANTAVECMQYYRAQPSTRADLLNEGSGDWPPVLQCADANPLDQAETTIINGTSGVFLYNYWYQYDLNSNNTCFEASLYMADMRDATVDIDQNITGEGLGVISCETGEICTTIFARGYNRPCSQLESLFTVQRELTIEY